MTTRRRIPGEGAIFKRPGGRWAASVDIGYGDRTRAPHNDSGQPMGRVRKRINIYGATRGEVEAKLQAIRRNQSNGIQAVDERVTVADYLTGWLDEIAPRLRPATLLRYRGIVKFQLLPALGNVRLAKLSPQDVARMIANLQTTARAKPGRSRKDGRKATRPASTLSPRTVHHVRAVLRAALSDAEMSGLVVRNVAKLTKPPRVAPPSPKLIPVDDIHKVIDALAGSDVENAVVLALYSGLRAGEVLGLRWSDVSFDTGQISVRKALQRLQGKTRLVEVKSGTSHRTLQLPQPALDALRDERRRQRERELAAPPGQWKPAIRDLVFTDITGAALVPTTVTRTFQKALTAAELPPLRFHHLRHLHAGLMLGSGADIATVSHLLGHSSIALTAGTYTGILPALKREAAERFERLLSRPG